jgi:hypothetical protein
MTLPRITALVQRRRVQAIAIVLLAPFLVLAPLHLFAPAPVKAHGVLAPVQIGISFNPHRAESMGLDYRRAFTRLEAMHFRVIRLSAYWDQIDQEGYGQLDWLMNEAQRAGQPIVLAVGMKGLGWPEFYIPSSAIPAAGLSQGQDVATDSSVREATLAFVNDTVVRYRNNSTLVAWQVENEPFNRAGPQRLWIDAAFLRQEVTSVRELDGHHRPLIVNAFSHFNLLLDQASARQGFDLRQWLGFEADSAERDGLSALNKGDVLGLDVYTAIGYRFLGQDQISHADGDWPDRLAKVRELARRQGKQAWITEAQAEPWESGVNSDVKPKSTSPQAIRSLFVNLKEAGFSTVLFWGAEYWLWRADNGDLRWIDTIKAIVRDEAKAPPMTAPTLPSPGGD